MPELPEVETLRISLHDSVVGQRITWLEVRDFVGVLGGDDPASFSARVRDRTIVGTRRRGKYILIDLDDGSVLAVHLRMTGNLSLLPREDPLVRFQHLAIGIGDQNSLRFSDQRKFGRVIHLMPQEAGLVEGKLGPEPLSQEFTSEVFARSLQRRTGPIKSILLNQKVVAGIGNIYADEALYRARLHPLTPANSLSQDQIRALHRAIRTVLREGLRNRGTSISHFRDGAGQEGANQNNLNVYGKGRTGGRCPRCGRPIEVLVIGGRSSHFCPNCQPLAI